MVRRAVSSVFEQSYRPIEIVLVNDGSTDNTGAVLDELAEIHVDEIRVVHKENGGAGLAREAGRQLARGEFIQYLDSDDWLLPNKFEDQVAALRANPECDIAYGTSMLVDINGEIINPVSRWTGKQFEYLLPSMLECRWWYTHTPLFTRKLSDAAGPWPRRRPEDWDLEARMGALKAKLIHCGTTVSCQREYPGDDRISRQGMAGYLKDEAWFLPRLYHCAVQAGIPAGSKEMQRFSRWAFLRARDLATLGEPEQASKLLHLANESAGREYWDVRLVRYCAMLVGWRITGYVLRLTQRMRKS